MHFPLGTPQEVIQATVKRLTEVKKAPGYSFGKEVARGMGFDPEKIERLGTDPEGHTHQLNELLELSNQFMKGGAKWLERVAKDPFKITEPVEAAASSIEQAIKGLSKDLTEEDFQDPATIKKIQAHLGNLTGALANVGAGAERGGIYRETAALPGRVVRRGLREISDVGPREVARQVAKVATENAEDIAKHARDVEEARLKDVEKLGKVRGEKAAEIREAAERRVERSRAEGQRASFARLEDKLGEQAAGMLDAAERRERATLDQRYTPYNSVTDKATFDLQPLEDSIAKSQGEIQKGTPTNQPIFNSILSRIKEKVELPSGELQAVPGANRINGAQLRGYISELGDAMFRGELPADIYLALKNVRKKAQAMVQAHIDDVMGKQAGEGYRELNRDWSNYEQAWRDRRSGSPLVKALQTIRTKGRNVPVYREVADQLLRKTPGEQSMSWLAKKRGFGADPQVVARLRDIDRQMKAVKVPTAPGAVEKPTLPKRTEVPPPKLQEFQQREFIEQGVRKKMQQMGNIGSGLGVFWALKDLLTGNPQAAAELGGAVGLAQTLKYLMTSKPFLEWVSKQR